MKSCVTAILLLFSVHWVGAAATHGMVASVHPVATEAGLAVLKNGGNAVDAAVAMALTLGVVNGENSGLGGGCFMLIRRANGSVVAIDGRETAPGAATRDMFIRNGKGDTDLSQTGPLASGVPGALAAYEYAVKHYGKKKLRDLLLPAAAIAENGFVVDAGYANVVKSVAGDIFRFESSRAVFFRNGRPLAQGDIFKQPELAATYRHIAEQGSTWFYQGPFAQAAEAWMKRRPSEGKGFPRLPGETARTGDLVLPRILGRWFPAAQLGGCARRANSQHPRALRRALA